MNHPRSSTLVPIQDAVRSFTFAAGVERVPEMTISLIPAGFTYAGEAIVNVTPLTRDLLVSLGWTPPMPISTGHGHVRPRADGVKFRCGGPGLCGPCSVESLGVDADKGRKLGIADE